MAAIWGDCTFFFGGGNPAQKDGRPLRADRSRTSCRRELAQGRRGFPAQQGAALLARSWPDCRWAPCPPGQSAAQPCPRDPHAPPNAAECSQSAVHQHTHKASNRRRRILRFFLVFNVLCPPYRREGIQRYRDPSARLSVSLSQPRL